MFYGTAGLAVVGAGVAGFYGLWFQDAHGQYVATVKRSLKQPVPASDFTEQGKRAEDRAQMTNVALIGTAVVAAVAGVEALFTDWTGAREAAQTASTPAAASLQVKPTGLALSFY